MGVYIAALAGLLILVFVYFDVTFSRGIIYRVEVLNDIEKTKRKITAANDLLARYEREPWWERDHCKWLVHDQRYLNWLVRAYNWAKQPWWKRLFQEPPGY